MWVQAFFPSNLCLVVVPTRDERGFLGKTVVSSREKIRQAHGKSGCN